MNYYYIKNVKPNEVSVKAISYEGYYCMVTVTPNSINQLVGRFGADKDDEYRNIFVNRMLQVWSKIDAEEFEVVQNFYAKNGSKMFFGDLNKKELNKIINEHSILKEVKDQNLDSEFGQIQLEF